jgi:hypothetical protein
MYQGAEQVFAAALIFLPRRQHKSCHLVQPGYRFFGTLGKQRLTAIAAAALK